MTNTFSFSYSFTFKGERRRMSLPYDPIASGWKFKKAINCCLHFTKGDYLLRIKTGTQVFVVEKEGRSRPVIQQTTPIQNQKRFNEICSLAS